MEEQQGQPTTSAALSTYRQRISLSKEEKDLKGIDSKVKRAIIHADSDILRTEEALTEAQERLDRAECADPFNLQNVINAEVEVENITEVLDRAREIKARLFPAS